MYFKDILKLISVTESVNDYGDTTETETETVAYCDVRSVRQSEFYQAHASGLKPEKVFVIRYDDFAEQGQAEFEGKRYKILRTFTKNQEWIELICQGIVGTERR